MQKKKHTDVSRENVWLSQSEATTVSEEKLDDNKYDIRHKKQHTVLAVQMKYSVPAVS